MEKKIKITGICGWALPEDWFAQVIESRFPDAQVEARHPNNPWDEQEASALLENSSPDLVIGYSLGSLWLLHHKDKIPPRTVIGLMAPILAFPREKNAGGKTPLGKLKYQKKILRQAEDFHSALKGFFDLSGINLPEPNRGLPYSRETLIQGLEFLETVEVPPDSTHGCIVVSGNRDALLDGRWLKNHIPHMTLVEDSDHSPHKLLDHLQNHPEIRALTQNPSTRSTLSQKVS
ncbi:MAG: hypothetical protein GWM98_07290 [Nitrospinaceae bacterium]|nr:WecB/TagA/CpsF family glycosyltransferase [Nitrospinaceae bacterium]NIR54340.1 WecB/TagA/CpsF family glycosyltransferase [Nitrospinaceae bacterium]NIS84758.1 WecB/TagA/CpsF family glycosyltransferase [Nitrospinaceae bacterium]NIT81559.1 WecB/TagA/CpsF family glycosyltransferase [Nitrospinaceae bacterium]NIU43844.1 WecB/TagA/CpsF family glycosyltransferase [Nitrospinaceae bacterium]